MRIPTELEQQFDQHLRRQPRLGRGVYLAPGAVVVGDVTLGEHSSVWHNAVVRGDTHRIVVGHHTNIQDNAVLHVSRELPCVLGNWVTVGHGAIVHACTVHDDVLIGMGATILDGAVIGEHSIVGANALVTERTVISAGSLVLGVPGRVARALTTEEKEQIREPALHYTALTAYCLTTKTGSG